MANETVLEHAAVNAGVFTHEECCGKSSFYYELDGEKGFKRVCCECQGLKSVVPLKSPNGEKLLELLG